MPSTGVLPSRIASLVIFLRTSDFTVHCFLPVHLCSIKRSLDRTSPFRDQNAPDAAVRDPPTSFARRSSCFLDCFCPSVFKPRPYSSSASMSAVGISRLSRTFLRNSSMRSISSRILAITLSIPCHLRSPR